jgi:hypothetical protein
MNRIFRIYNKLNASVFDLIAGDLEVFPYCHKETYTIKYSTTKVQQVGL